MTIPFTQHFDAWLPDVAAPVRITSIYDAQVFTRRWVIRDKDPLLKVLLRMTSERHAVASKVIATVDDLEQIAADDAADVAALRGWRRELFGDAALSLKHGRLALAIEKGRVVRVDRN